MATASVAKNENQSAIVKWMSNKEDQINKGRERMSSSVAEALKLDFIAYTRRSSIHYACEAKDHYAHADSQAEALLMMEARVSVVIVVGMYMDVNIGGTTQTVPTQVKSESRLLHSAVRARGRGESIL
jgi:hypothetical protein